jgi:thymidylate kinase
MKILIIEGIATSGKSSLIKKISNLLEKDTIRVYGEAETHVPIMDKTSDLHIEFFKLLLEDSAKVKKELTIFDRFHLTQAFRAKVSVDKYFEFEDLLLAHSTLIAYLMVDEQAIPNRVKLATQHREASWGEYVKTKGKSLDEIAQYYSEQQRNQLHLLEQSKLESRVFNTTNHDYEAIAKIIINEWFNER